MIKIAEMSCSAKSVYIALASTNKPLTIADIMAVSGTPERTAYL
jgi:hypothetical protein